LPDGNTHIKLFVYYMQTINFHCIVDAHQVIPRNTPRHKFTLFATIDSQIFKKF